MQKYLIFLFFICACSSSKNIVKETNPASQIIWKELLAINLSEDMSVISTQSDELILQTFLVEKNADQIKLLKTQSYPDIVLDSLTRSFSLMDTFDLSANIETQFLVASLVEMDETDTHKQIIIQMEELVKDGIFLEEIDLIAVDSLIGYDDFLGMQSRRIEKLDAGSKRKMIFKGRQLFDRYEFHLTFEVN